MAWDSAVITNGGAELMKKCYAGETLVIDFATGGTGAVATESLMAQTELKNQKQQFGIVQKTDTKNGVKLNIAIDSIGLESGYVMNQIGVWAHLKNGAQTLLAIIQDTDGIRIPSQSEILDFALNFYAVLAISGSGNIQLSQETDALVSMVYLREALSQKPDFIIGNTEPDYGPVLWFDTRDRTGAGIVMLDFSEDSGSAAVTAETGGKSYAVDNAGINTVPTETSYSFDII